MTEFAEFRLRIEPGPTPTTYRIDASGPGGDHSAAFELPFTDEQLENFILKVGRTRRGVRRIESPEMELARRFGGQLFGALMAGGIGEAYRAANAEARALKQGLRVTLSMTQVPKLATIPWEFLFDDPDFLSTSSRTPVVRSLDVMKPRRPFDLSLPIRILAVISAPSDAVQLNVAKERQNLENALAPLIATNSLAIDWLEAATLLALNRKVRQGDYHILHFIGHGGFDNAHKEGALLFENENGLGDIVGADRLATIVRDRESLQLVVLNSCEGARGSIDDPFSGVAAALIEREVPAVIGMQFEITDRAAILFATEFYTVLAEGQPVDSAVAEARRAIFADANDVEWATPVLFMRVADGRLFNIIDAVPIIRVEPDLPAKDADRVAEPAGDTPGPEPATSPTTVEAALTALAGAGAAGPPATPTAVPDARSSVPPPITTTGPPATGAAVPARRFPAWAWALVGIAVLAPIVLLVALLIPPGPAAAAISVDPVDGASGVVFIRGSGFASQESVNLTANGQPLTPTRADSSGTFAAQRGVGLNASGTVVATGAESGRTAVTDYTLASTLGPSVSLPVLATTTPAGSGSVVPSTAPPSEPATVSSYPPIVCPRFTGIAELAPLSDLPDDSIVFYSDHSDLSRSTNNELYAVDPKSGQIYQLTNFGGNNRFASWSQNHTLIVYTRGDGSNRDIYVLTPESTLAGNPGTPLIGDSATDDWYPQMAPDGTIAFVRGNRTSEIRTWAQGVVSPDPVYAEQNFVRGPAWSVDGSRLAFFGELEGNNFDIATADKFGRDVKIFQIPATSELNPTWSPDGSTLAIVLRDDDDDAPSSDIWLFDIATGRPTQQLTSDPSDDPRQDGNPVWSRDGNRLAFYKETPEGGYHIWIMNPDGTSPCDLTPNRPGRNLDPNWR